MKIIVEIMQMTCQSKFQNDQRLWKKELKNTNQTTANISSPKYS